MIECAFSTNNDMASWIAFICFRNFCAETISSFHEWYISINSSSRPEQSSGPETSLHIDWDTHSQSKGLQFECYGCPGANVQRTIQNNRRNRRSRCRFHSLLSSRSARRAAFTPTTLHPSGQWPRNTMPSRMRTVPTPCGINTLILTDIRHLRDSINCSPLKMINGSVEIACIWKKPWIIDGMYHPRTLASTIWKMIWKMRPMLSLRPVVL